MCSGAGSPRAASCTSLYNMTSGCRAKTPSAGADRQAAASPTPASGPGLNAQQAASERLLAASHLLRPLRKDPEERERGYLNGHRLSGNHGFLDRLGGGGHAAPNHQQAADRAERQDADPDRTRWPFCQTGPEFTPLTSTQLRSPSRLSPDGGWLSSRPENETISESLGSDADPGYSQNLHVL